MSPIAVDISGPIATIRLNRPDTMNPLGLEGDGDAVAEACAAINRDKSIRCVIITGEGRAFSAGGDLKAMQDPNGPFSGGGVAIRDRYRNNIHKLTRALYGIEVPVIAAVNGAAIGLGCDVACLADIRLASDRARFAVTFLKIGLVPGDGGSWILPRVIGMGRASELFYTGDVIDAETAASWGLVNRVVPHDQLMDEARALAERIAAQPGEAARLTKSLLRQGQTTSYDGALEMAAAAQALCHHTADHHEGVAAMIEKRSPVFNRG